MRNKARKIYKTRKNPHFSRFLYYLCSKSFNINYMGKFEVAKINRQDNKVTDRRCNWTPLMTKCYYRVINLLEIRYKQYKEEVQKDLFGMDDYSPFLSYNISNADFGIDAEHAYTIKQALARIQAYPLQIIGSVNDNKDWKSLTLLTVAIYHEKTGMFELKLSPDCVKYFLELRNTYTAIDYVTALQFSGKYTPRFYEWACRWRTVGHFSKSIEEMKDILMLNKHKDELTGKIIKEKYQKTPDFIKYVLTPSIEELKSCFDAGNCDIYLEATPEELTTPHRGRPTVTKYKFQIILSENDKIKKNNLSEEEAQLYKKCQSIQAILSWYLEKSKAQDKETYPNKIANQVFHRARNGEIELPEKVRDKINERYTAYCKTGHTTFTDFGKILRKVLEQDFQLI